ncbi:MAG: sigma-70 family RNA polymerase sigma factor [Clostridia bacterium]|nr:sigma-70 family RNA polymerase sigma factor [Clostridia bacterium]
MSLQNDLNTNEFVKNNLGLVHSCCKRFAKKGIEYDDLFGAGCLGLTKAIKGFDASRGLQFSTYATPVIFGEIRRLFRDGGSVKVSRSLKELSLKVVKTSSMLSQDLGREPTIFEIANAMDISAEQVSEALCASKPCLSLTFSDEDGDEFSLEPSVNGCEDSFIDCTALSQCLEYLDEDERKIIEYRYYEGKTQSVTAGFLGVSQVQISRKEKQILMKLRSLLL